MRILKCGKIRNRLLEGLIEATLGVLVSLSASAAIPMDEFRNKLDGSIPSLSGLSALRSFSVGANNLRGDSIAPAADLERYGAQPDLPLPHKSMLPTVKIAPARWPEAVRPTPAQ